MADEKKVRAIKINNTKALAGLLGDVRKTNNFRLFINGVTEKNDLDLIVQRAFLPQVSVTPLELRHGNDSIKLAGTASWQGGSIVIQDVLSRTELDAVLEWRDKVYRYDSNDGGIIGLADEYKKNGYIVEYAADGRFQRRWPLKGMWISDINLGELNAADASLKEISFTIQIDPSPTKPEYYDEKVADYRSKNYND